MMNAIEMKEEELFEINGGNIFTDAYNSVKGFCKQHTGAAIGGVVVGGIFGVLTGGLGLLPAMGIVMTTSAVGALEGELIEQVVDELK